MWPPWGSLLIPNHAGAWVSLFVDTESQGQCRPKEGDHFSSTGSPCVYLCPLLTFILSSLSSTRSGWELCVPTSLDTPPPQQPGSKNWMAWIWDAERRTEGGWEHLLTHLGAEFIAHSLQSAHSSWYSWVGIFSGCKKFVSSRVLLKAGGAQLFPKLENESFTLRITEIPSDLTTIVSVLSLTYRRVCFLTRWEWNRVTVWGDSSIRYHKAETRRVVMGWGLRGRGC